MPDGRRLDLLADDRAPPCHQHSRFQTFSFVNIMNTALTLLMLLAAGAQQPVSPDKGQPADAPLQPFQVAMIEQAFDAASAMPLEPHIKNRSRAQQAAVLACLELGQPARALRYSDRIDNWRRGNGYAEIAIYSARHGYADHAKTCAQLAALEAAEPGLADWRRDRINMRIAKAYNLLGQAAEAEALAATLGTAEMGKVAPDDEADLDQRMAEVDRMVGLGNLDITRNTLESFTELFDRLYNDAGQRAKVADKIRTSWKGLPPFLRIELLTSMARMALEHADKPAALSLINEAQRIFDEATWPLDARLKMTATLAAIRFESGDEQRARADADAALALYDARGETIVNMYRAAAVRPLAEAYKTMNDTAASLAVYRRALEAGVVNPNARPRAIDLAATCTSMAVHGVEPDADLGARIREIGHGLGPPW